MSRREAIKRFGERITNLDRYTVNVDASRDGCQNCEASSASVPVCSSEGYFVDYCKSCAREVTGVE